MNEAFNRWWNEDLLTEDNSFVDGTPAYWAWEGWCAALAEQPAQQEPVATAYFEKITGRIVPPDDTHRRKFPMCYRPLVFGDTSPQPAQQEPVAWATQLNEYAHIQWGAKRPEYPMVYEFPLYTSPPAQRTWVGLTDEEIKKLAAPLFMTHYWKLCNEFARAIEAKSKELNT